MDKRFLKYNIILLLLIIAENYTLFFYSVNSGLQLLNASCYFFSSLLVGSILIQKFKGKYVQKIPVALPSIKVWMPVAIFTILCLLYLARKDSNLFHEIPIDPKRSDIIPTIEVLVKRMIHGASVYEPIEQFGYHLPVTYLPLQWIVYTPAEILGFDYRWIAFIIWAASAIMILIRLFKINDKSFKFLMPALLFGIYYLLLKKHSDVISNTVETMVSGYYIILIIFLNQKNSILLGAAIALCMLSRFSLVVWLPLWTFVLYISGERKLLFRSILTTMLVVLLVYVIPFLSKDWNAFARGFQAYDGAALGEWNHIDYNTMKPFHLNSGVGFAFFFAEKYHSNLSEGLKLLQRVQLIMCLSTVFLMGLWYWKQRKYVEYRIFLMASFKIYLSVFLLFIQVPYIYLMIVANFVSIAIFVEQLVYKISDSNIKSASIEKL